MIQNAVFCGKNDSEGSSDYYVYLIRVKQITSVSTFDYLSIVNWIMKR